MLLRVYNSILQFPLKSLYPCLTAADSLCPWKLLDYKPLLLVHMCKVKTWYTFSTYKLRSADFEKRIEYFFWSRGRWGDGTNRSVDMMVSTTTYVLWLLAAYTSICIAQDEEFKLRKYRYYCFFFSIIFSSWTSFLFKNTKFNIKPFKFVISYHQCTCNLNSLCACSSFQIKTMEIHFIASAIYLPLFYFIFPTSAQFK